MFISVLRLTASWGFAVTLSSLLALAVMCMWDLLFVFFMINAFFVLLCVLVDMLLLIGSWCYLLVAGGYRVEGRSA